MDIDRIDQNTFFREATLHICGRLEPDRFLKDSFDYLCQYIPADQILLTHYYPEKEEHAVLAAATADAARLMNLKIKMPPEIQKFVVRSNEQTLVIDRAENHPTAGPWVSQGLLEPDASLLVCRLVAEQEVVGGLVFMARGAGRFNEGHARLVSLLRKPFTIALSNSVRYMELLELKELLAEDYRHLQQDLLAVGDEIVGLNFGLKEVMDQVRQVAPLNSPVLLMGETGTGKELLAAAIHNLSSRKNGPFIKVNCGAIPDSLMDSELFGHEKGAFTGALARKRGRFERADGGTIFLDEIGELKHEAQVRLLRVLQEKEIERVGGTETIKVDIRVVAATHQDLAGMTAQGSFRQDLYFRLNVFPLKLPPLRERKGDIPSLVQHFIQKKYRDLGLKSIPRVPPEAMDRLMAYQWPGNIRQLENTVERAMILSRGRPLFFPELSPEHEAAAGERLDDRAESIKTFPEKTVPALDDLVSDHIRRVLDLTKGKVGGERGAAALLKVNPSTLRKKMRKLGVPFGRKAG